MSTPTSRKEVHELFQFGISIKGLIAVIEILSGIFILSIPSIYVNELVQLVLRNGANDPDNFALQQLVAAAKNFSVSTAVFIGAYLLIRGIIKSGLVLALFRNKEWAYPASLITLGLFDVFQTVEFLIRGSFIILGLTTIDLIVLFIIWKEWQIQKTRRQTPIPD